MKPPTGENAFKFSDFYINFAWNKLLREFISICTEGMITTNCTLQFRIIHNEQLNNTMNEKSVEFRKAHSVITNLIVHTEWG